MTASNDTGLWLVDLDASAEALERIEAAAPRLPLEQRARLEAIRDPAARRERMLSHIALRILLEQASGTSAVRKLPFEIGASGKPSLPAGYPSFSLAHTNGHALIAIAPRGRLGVDIERLRPISIPDARRVPIEAEAVRLAAGAPLAGERDRDARFLRAWVRIEAVAKAEGTGVGPMLERLRPAVESSVLRQSAHPGACHSVVAHDVPVPEGLFAAVALEKGLAPPDLEALPASRAAIEAGLAPGEPTSR